jgi:carbamoyltransferase
MDAVFLFAENGAVYAAWHGGEREAQEGGGRFRKWLAAWSAETGFALPSPDEP